MTTEEGNKIIAEFMGWIHHSDPYYDTLEMKLLKYHSSWDWLMPVVEKIESLWISGAKTRFKIYGTFVEVVHEVGYHNIDYARNSNIKKDDQLGGGVYYNSNSKIENVYKMVIQFIQWYNKNSQQ